MQVKQGNISEIITLILASSIITPFVLFSLSILASLVVTDPISLLHKKP
ncbi:MAG TPA: hypothetical protein VFY64_07055 [Nitrososphaeraceae archaeon]|nr:hypothetical protein [Nitrososphaeraceae archaeon]